MADVANPLDWKNTGTSIAASMISGKIFVIEDTAYLCGWANSSLVPQQTILSSTDGWNWTPNAGVPTMNQFPSGIERNIMIVLSGVAYSYGGREGASRLQSNKIFATSGFVSGTTIGKLPAYPTGTLGESSGWPSRLSTQHRLGGIRPELYYSVSTGTIVRDKPTGSLTWS